MIFEVAVRRLGSHHQGSVVVLRDISEQRKVAEPLLRQERIAAMGHLAAGIAHDFNNLIQAITILAESLLLDESGDHPSRKPKTREILAVSERAATLIRQILDYSRQTATRPQLIDLRSFLVETLTMLNRLIPETVRIEIDAAPGEHTIRFDPVQLQQVLTNLTVNSSQAMPNGGEIRVRLWNPSTTRIGPGSIAGSEGGDWVCLSLTDTGCGIPPEARPHIFEPFFTTKERGQGTGLGLAQSYGIIQQNHGRITFETEVGHGTTFTLYLPVEYEEAASSEPKQTAPPLPSGIERRSSWSRTTPRFGSSPASSSRLSAIHLHRPQRNRGVGGDGNGRGGGPPRALRCGNADHGRRRTGGRNPAAQPVHPDRAHERVRAGSHGRRLFKPQSRRLAPEALLGRCSRLHSGGDPVGEFLIHNFDFLISSHGYLDRSAGGMFIQALAGLLRSN